MQLALAAKRSGLANLTQHQVREDEESETSREKLWSCEERRESNERIEKDVFNSNWSDEKNNTRRAPAERRNGGETG